MGITLARKKDIADLMISYSKTMGDWTRPVSFRRKLRIENANEFLISVILDRGVLADAVAWSSGRLAYHVIGEPFWQQLADMEAKRLRNFLRYGKGGKALHRYIEQFTRILPEAGRYMVEHYDGDARRIWNGVDVPTARERLNEIPGIGPALADMTVLILVRNYGLLGGKAALKELRPKLDMQVRRVFLRTGLVQLNASDEDHFAVAQQLSSKYPAALDAPAWEIGSKYCKPQNPKCDECPLASRCPSRGIL